MCICYNTHIYIYIYTYESRHGRCIVRLHTDAHTRARLALHIYRYIVRAESLLYWCHKKGRIKIGNIFTSRSLKSALARDRKERERERARYPPIMPFLLLASFSISKLRLRAAAFRVRVLSFSFSLARELVFLLGPPEKFRARFLVCVCVCVHVCVWGL